jgi:uncharacterized protein (TIGR02001 family)
VLFNFGYIYYWYPGAKDSSAELDYVELRAGYSTSFIKNLTTGTTIFWSPEYTGDTDEVITVESVATYALPTMGIFAPSISGTWGWNKSLDDNANYISLVANGDDEYNYWNVGLTLVVDKIAFDFRYWDTDISNAGGFCDGSATGVLQCDSTFVFSTKVTLP